MKLLHGCPGPLTSPKRNCGGKKIVSSSIQHEDPDFPSFQLLPSDSFGGAKETKRPPCRPNRSCQIQGPDHSIYLRRKLCTGQRVDIHCSYEHVSVQRPFLGKSVLEI